MQHDVCAVGEPTPFDSGIGRFAVEHRGTVGDRLPCRGAARQHVRKGIPIRQRTPGGSGGRIRRRKRQHVSVPPPDVPGDIRFGGITVLPLQAAGRPHLRLRPGDDPHDAGNVRRRGPAEQQLLVHDGKDTKLSRGVIRTRQNFRTGDNS